MIEIYQIGNIAQSMLTTSQTWMEFMLGTDHITGFVVTQPNLMEPHCFLGVFYADKTQFVVPLERTIWTPGMEEQAVSIMVDSIRALRDSHQAKGPMHFEVH